MFIEQCLLLRHAKLARVRIVKRYLDKSTISSRSKRMNFPYLPILTPHDTSFLKAQKLLSKRMIDMNLDNLISIFHFLLIFLALSLKSNKLPNIILRNMITSIRTTRNLIMQFTFWMLYLMGM